MTIRLRILALLALLSLFCIGMTEYFTWLHVEEETNAREYQTRAMSVRLQRLIGAQARAAVDFLEAAAVPSGRQAAGLSGGPTVAGNAPVGGPARRVVDAVWTLRADGTVVTATGSSGSPNFPLAGPEGAEWWKQPSIHSFFLPIEGQLWHIQGRLVNSGSDPAAGVVQFAGQIWGERVLQELAEAAEGRVILTGTKHLSDVRSGEELEVWLPLLDHRGRIVAGLDYHLADASLVDEAMEKIERVLFILNGAGALGIVALALHLWFLRPFSRLRTSLESRDPQWLAPLLPQQNEFGQMARVVQSSMEDRVKLQQSLDERVRLGRELHDGAIQSVYGTRMALGSALSLLGRDVPAARKLLEETGTELDRVLVELRRHIEAVDPRPLDSTFAEAVGRLVRQLQGASPLKAELAIDEQLVSSHPVLHRSQALQFVREAVSNALRHGHPSRLRVSWQRTAEGSLLEVADDGQGFDPQAGQTGGRGLTNLGERAVALGGRLEIETAAGRGTTIRLKMSAPDTRP